MPVGLYAGANVSNGNGVTTLFPYNFKILDRTHIEVKVDGVVKVLGADYDVTGVGLSNGGNVVFTVAPANLAVVQRARKVPYKRDTDYQANGDLREDTLDPDLDLEEMQVQQLAADILRAFKAPLSVTADQVLTDAMWAARANMLLGFDGAGGFGVFAALNQALVSAFMTTVLDDATAAAVFDTLVANGTASTLLAKLTTEKLALTGVISPAQLVANTNDWAPAGFATAATIRFSTDASRNITGIAGGAEGRFIVLHNIGAQPAVLKAQDAGSIAANRFAFDADITLLADQSCVLMYDATTGRWRHVEYSNGEFRSVQVITASGTYNRPTGLKRARVRLVAGGGGSGGVAATGAGQSSISPGAPSGGYAERMLTAAQIGASQVVTIGAGGIAGIAGTSTGGAGGTTSFGALLSATGSAGTTGSGARGDAYMLPCTAGIGIGSGGDINVSGSAGQSSFTNVGATQPVGGAGAPSLLGGTAAAVLVFATSAGAAGANYGGGATGAANGQTQAAQAGSAGAPGVIIVEEFF